MTIKFRVCFDGLKVVLRNIGKKIRRCKILAHCGYILIKDSIHGVHSCDFPCGVGDTIFAISVVTIHDTYLGRGQTCPSRPIFRMKYDNMFSLLFQVCKL